MSNTCRCKDPPGGTVTCRDDQVPYCYVTASGQRFMGCYDPPEDVETGQQLQNWVLGWVLDQPRELDQFVTQIEAAILLGGSYTRPDGTVITFKLPPRNDYFPGGTPPNQGGFGGSNTRGGFGSAS